MGSFICQARHNNDHINPPNPPDRIVPEARRYVPLTAPCANDATVPHFTTPQLENPLTLQVGPRFVD